MKNPNILVMFVENLLNTISKTPQFVTKLSMMTLKTPRFRTTVDKIKTIFIAKFILSNTKVPIFIP